MAEFSLRVFQVNSVRLALLALTLAITVQANPIASALMDKTWEDCRVVIGAESAQVSCTVGYRVWENLKDGVYIQVPVFVPAATALDKKTLERAIACRVTHGERSFTPTDIGEDTSIRKPPGTKCLAFGFSLPPPIAKEFPLTVRYSQPLIDGVFYYLPQFEHAQTEIEQTKLSILATPAGPGIRLTLTSPNHEVIENTPARIKLVPAHHKLISITTREK